MLSLDTVKKHVGHVLDKLGAANRTQAVARARELGLIPSPAHLSAPAAPSCRRPGHGIHHLTGALSGDAPPPARGEMAR